MSEREAFEAFARTKLGWDSGDLKAGGLEGYGTWWARDAWLTWQARAAAERAPLQSAPQPLPKLKACGWPELPCKCEFPDLYEVAPPQVPSAVPREPFGPIPLLALHTLRNPWGHSPDEVREARLWAADVIERLYAVPQPVAWQPMETAPKDGREVILRDAHLVRILAHYMPGGHCIEDHPPIDAGWFYWTGHTFASDFKPVCWMPAPYKTVAERIAPPQPALMEEKDETK